MASRRRFVSPDGSQRGHRARGRVKKLHPSAYATLASAGERRQKGQRTPSLTVCRGQQSSARPLGTKRLQRLSRKSRSQYSKRDRRSPLILRAAPATRSSSTLEPEPSRRPRAAPATSTPRARETSAPRAQLAALGSASSPVRRPATSRNPGDARDAASTKCRASGPGTTPAAPRQNPIRVPSPNKKRKYKQIDGRP